MILKDLQYSPSNTEIISVFDPAIRPTESDELLIAERKALVAQGKAQTLSLVGTELLEFAQTRNEKFIRFREGMKPVRFQIKNLSTLLIESLMEKFNLKQNLIQRSIAYFSYGVDRIENPQQWILNRGVKIDGSSDVTTDKETEVFGLTVKHFDPASIIKYLNPQVIDDISACIQAINFSTAGMPVQYPTSHCYPLFQKRILADWLFVEKKEQEKESV